MEDLEALDSPRLVELTGSDWETMRTACRILFARGRPALEAVMAGLEHPNWRVRRCCASLLDHLADARAAGPLARVLKHDPIEAVRRNALHSLSCHDCKAVPLGVDVIGPLVDAALADRSLAVRRRAWQYLVGQPPDARVVAAARSILGSEMDPAVLCRARRALDWHLAGTPAPPTRCDVASDERVPWACGSVTGPSLICPRRTS